MEVRSVAGSMDGEEACVRGTMDEDEAVKDDCVDHFVRPPAVPLHVGAGEAGKDNDLGRGTCEEGAWVDDQQLVPIHCIDFDSHEKAVAVALALFP
mmetsp:Transcript_37391/g.77568  ORF Transcript_37391/g.77568 Transcript_37391/m.77568 type:complete len:96 (+) Transcript_37391:354-641(+)